MWISVQKNVTYCNIMNVSLAQSRGWNVKEILVAQMVIYQSPVNKIWSANLRSDLTKSMQGSK